MTTVAEVAATAPDQLTNAYRSQRRMIIEKVTAGVAAAWAALHANRDQTIAANIALVEAGQATIARLVDSYMTTLQIAELGHGSLEGLTAADYTALRGIDAATVYARPFGAYGTFIAQGADEARAVQAATASAEKLAATDLQLAQTHAARDWMQGNEFVVGYRRVLNPPSCPLCTAASTRTYRKADLMPIHEHCDCGVMPLWGHEPVASVGTKVRIEDDPEIGPRLMASDWSNVGPRLIEKPL